MNDQPADSAAPEDVPPWKRRALDQPFPQWILKRDATAAKWEQNGYFTAFHRHRLHRTSRFRYGAMIVINILNALASHVAMIGAAVLASLFIGPCLGIIVTGTLLLAWKLAARVVHRSIEGRLPGYFERCFIPRPQRRLLEDMRLVPSGPLEAGEALLLERIQREWPGRVIGYWMLIAFGIFAATFRDGCLGPGDMMLAGFSVLAAIAWLPVVYFDQVGRLARHLNEQLFSAISPSSGDRTAVALNDIAATFLYLPFMFLLIFFEAAFAYILLHEVFRLVMIWLFSWITGSPPDLAIIEEVTQALIGVVLLASIPLARRTSNFSRNLWQMHAMVYTVDASRISGAAMDE